MTGGSKEGENTVNTRKRWTQEQKEWLECSWGVIGTNTIARKLGRSLGAVRCMAYRVLRLGPAGRASGCVSARELHRAIRGPSSNHNHPEQAFARMGLRSRRVRNNRQCGYMIRLEDFWKWARTHMDYIALDVFTPGTLGREPAWMERERKARAGRKATWQPWTEAETERLRMGIAGGETLRQIAADLGRTERSCEYRIARLGKTRPAPEPRRPWNERERMRAAGFFRAGYTYGEIGRIMGRSTEATRLAIKRIMRDPVCGSW